MTDTPSPPPQSATPQLVALGWDQQQAPTVLAKGSGNLAADLKAEAERLGVFIHEDPSLVAFLQQLDVGERIPQELYLVIAELISFSYVLQGKRPASWRDSRDQQHHQV